MDKRPVNENDIDKNYDESGNLLKLNGSQDLHWNYRDNIAYVDIINRPSGKNDSEYYVYDSSGQRVRKVTETYQNDEAHSTKVDKIYFGDIEVTRTYQESDLKKEKYTVHIMDDKSRVALHHYYTKGSSEETKNSQSRYQLSNHLDSVALELNDNAEIMTYEEYLPFGGTALIAGKTTREITEKEYRYSGKERDNSTGLYYYGARYYAPCLSRWINPDLAGTVDGPNLYLFVGGNPINGVDVGGMTFMSSNMMTEVILAPYTETIVKKDFFRNGDKFYGIYDVRKEKGTAPYIIEARESGYQNVTINDLMERVIDPITKQSKVHHSKLPTSLQPDEESKSFLDHMMNEEHYNIKKYKQKAENLRDPNTRDLDMSKTEVQEKIKEIKKQLVTYASKGGINYITSRSDDDKLSNKIYFVLDDINMGIVPQKIYSESLKKDQGNNQYKDVTGQELRYLYRNRDNEKMMRNVVFLRDRKKVVAPWKSTELANVYEKNSNGKFKIKGQKILAQIWSEYKPKGKAVNSNEQTRSSNIRQNPNRG